MGTINRAMWKSFSNISAGKYSKIRNFVSHPVDNKRKLYFFADAPHILKNLRTALINNKVITLPDELQKSNKLSSCTVQFSHLTELVDIQENLYFKLAPKLNKTVINLTLIR